MSKVYVSVDIPGHGTYVATASALDKQLESHAAILRNKTEERKLAIMREIAEQATGNQISYADVEEVSTLLIILASFEGDQFA